MVCYGIFWSGQFSAPRTRDSFRVMLARDFSGLPKQCHAAAAGKRGHQWCLSLTPNNTETMKRMACHCFLRPIRRHLKSSSYTTANSESLNFSYCSPISNHLFNLAVVHGARFHGNFWPLKHFCLLGLIDINVIQWRFSS